MKKLIMAATIALLTVGCGESKPEEKLAPACGSNDVKNMIIDGFSANSTEETKKQIEKNKKNIQELEAKIQKDSHGPMVKLWEKFLADNKKSLAANEAALKNGENSYNFDLKRILTESVDDRAQKSVCKAELHATREGKHYIWDLEYTAQYTSDGELIIETERYKNFKINWIWGVKSVTDVKPEKKTNHSVEPNDNNIIQQKKTVNKKETISRNIVSNAPQCTFFKVSGVRQLNLRDKPGKPSKVIGRVNMNESVCVYDSIGKWARSDRGWISLKYLRKEIGKNKFLLADIDHDRQKERLQLENIPSDDPEIELYQLKLFDNDGRLLWEGPRENDPLVVGYEYVSGSFPVIFNDIDGDGNTELIISSPPHEGTSPGSEIYRWTGKDFVRTTSTQYLDLVWVDAPYGKTLKWTKIDQKDYSKNKKIWWVGEFWQMPNNELPIVEIAGVQYPESSLVSRSKAKIRFTPTGAVIEEWIK